MIEYEIDLARLKQMIHDRPNLAIHCDDKEKAIALFKLLDSLEYVWRSGMELTTGTTCWDAYKERTCYVIGTTRITYTGIGSTSASVLDIVEFDDIVELEKKSAESFLNFLGGQPWANTI